MRNLQKLHSHQQIFSLQENFVRALCHNNNNKSRNLQNSIAIFMCGFSSATTMQLKAHRITERLISISDEPTKWQTIYILNLTIPLEDIHFVCNAAWSLFVCSCNGVFLKYEYIGKCVVKVNDS